MRRGFTLMEIVVGIALLIIIVSTASLSIERIQEERAISEAKDRVTETLQQYADRSFNDGRVYEIILNLGEKEMEVRVQGESAVEERVALPEILDYYINKDSDGIADYEKVQTTANGGMTSFSIYIFNTGREAVYRIAVDGINTSKLAYVNVYKNKVSNIMYDGIEGYEYKPGEWEKE